MFQLTVPPLRSALTSAVLALLTCCPYGDAQTVSPPSSQGRSASSYGKLPISFEPNVGQASGTVQFLAHARDSTLFLTPGQIVLALVDRDATSRSFKVQRDQNRTEAARRSLVQLQLVGANLKSLVAGEESLPGKVNYFEGSDPGAWHTNVPTFRRVHYRDIYPGIDVIYYGNREGKLEHDFIVAPGADPNKIAFAIHGPARTDFNNQELSIHTQSGDVVLHPPTAYQDIQGSRRVIAASYRIANNGDVHFRLAKYDRTRPLVIDPVVTHVSVFGGTDTDFPEAIAVDKYGQAYICGLTYSTDFPLANAFQASWTPNGPQANFTGFVTKINAAGTALVYSTYLGGSFTEADSIVVDPSGRAYVAGTTGPGFPLKNANQPAYGGGPSDGFITILSYGGNSLVYSSYLGGNEADVVRAIARDSTGNIYLTGRTDGGFPSLHTLASPGTPGIFVAKTNSAGALQYSVMYGNVGGSSTSITADSAGSAYIAGYDNFGNAPITSSALQKTCPNPSCGFVAKLSPSGTSLVYSTFIANNSASATGIAVDSDNNAYVAGATGDGLKVSSTAFQKTNAGGTDGFVSKLNSTGSSLMWSTYLGGSDEDVVTSMALDSHRTVYLTGFTCSPNFPQKASIQKWVQLTGQTSCQLFVTTLNASLSGIKYYSTYFGGPASYAYDYLTIDSKLNVYLTGADLGNIHATRGALSKSNDGSMDAFAAKLDIVDDIAFTQKPSATHVYTGDYLTYQLTATSIGPDFGSNLLIADSVPGGTVFVSADAGGGTCSTPVPGQLGALNCRLPQLNKGASWTVLFKVKVIATLPGTVYNGASAGASTQDFNLSNNTSETYVPMN